MIIKSMNWFKKYKKERNEVAKIRSYRESNDEYIERKWIIDRMKPISYDLEHYEDIMFIEP